MAMMKNDSVTKDVIIRRHTSLYCMYCVLAVFKLSVEMSKGKSTSKQLYTIDVSLQKRPSN